MEERLQKILSRSGFGSRRACEEMIVMGRVTVNGEKITDPKHTFAKDDFGSDFILKKGKKNFMKYTLG